ncbi:protein kinase domain-containing protein [Actinophytocola sp.]|uniref:protein kinase domain-containing protein n=1 Tax=Actinophytocola sp. TaxID=1872138 RepID=UPI002D2681BB|nr:phosphotransferase [Actinophytocola sp.]HYQ62439.1 phosphotransferase [Actinophytocola sp.]
MKQGQLIGGYTVLTRPTNADAGKCLWAFAEKGGDQYFIKEFLDPKIPRADGMGSVADKERRFAECQRFAARHERVMTLLPADHEDAGNLVLAVDFFAEGTRYYKVTPRVNASDAVPDELEPRAQIVLLRTLVDSLRLLHRSGIVHGDLKPENVLLAKPRQGPLLIAKLIDFDDSYPAGEPPPKDTIGGNPLYGAPEWLGYVRDGRRGKSLTQAVDMFALGLLIHTYLFGGPPRYGTAHESPAAAVLDGVRLDWDAGIGGRLRHLLTALTSADPSTRPDISTVAEHLAAPDILTAGEPTPVATPATSERVRFNFTARRPATARLRINMTSDD